MFSTIDFHILFGKHKTEHLSNLIELKQCQRLRNYFGGKAIESTQYSANKDYNEFAILQNTKLCAYIHVCVLKRFLLAYDLPPHRFIKMY